MSRRVVWFSAGAPSCVAGRLGNADTWAYCETGSEHEDNQRFIADVEAKFGITVNRLRSKIYKDTWDVWEKRRYIVGNWGAPCTLELKVKPRLDFQLPDDIHIFGYTADPRDVRRAHSFSEHWPDLTVEFPLIEAGLTKAACRALIAEWGLEEPLTYKLGMPCANCIPCCKATSPDYWALMRHHFPDKFHRIAELGDEISPPDESKGHKGGLRMTRLNGKRIDIREIPPDHPMTKPEQPECDFLCQLAEEDGQ